MSHDSKDPVVVIGGGPAGSTAATLIARAGQRVLLLERERFPRFHIGESLIPETYGVLERLGMLPKMKGSHFVKKYSVQFVGASGRLSEPFYFVDHKPHPSSQTWQVRRSEFDQLLLENAREHGVDAREGVRVLEVLFEGARAVGVRIQDADGVERVVRASVVVDASGQSSMIMSRLGLREWDPVLKKAALWTYWKGAYRDTGRDEGATIVLQIQSKQGWFWYIPLHDDIVSVGVVASYEYLFKNRADKDHATIYGEEVDCCPAVKERIQHAERVDAILRGQRVFLSLASGGWRRLGAGRRRFWFSRSALFVGRVAGAEIGPVGGRRGGRGAGGRRYLGGPTRQMGSRLHQGNGSDAAAGVRVL